MFSNRSVSTQPFAAPIAHAGTPDALIVCSAVVRSSQVDGASTPASSNACLLNQIFDLLAPLKKKPYSVPSMVPRSTQSCEKFAVTSSFMKSRGFRAPRLWGCGGETDDLQ